jgi:hypothetical protein
MLAAPSIEDLGPGSHGVSIQNAIESQPS